MDVEQQRKRRPRQAVILIAVGLAVVLSLPFAVWKRYGTFKYVQPSISVTTAKDATGYSAEILIVNLSCEEAKSLCLDHAELCGQAPDGTALPILIGDL